MAEFSAFVPLCMVAGPNGVDLKKFQMRVKFKIGFKFGLKIKKKFSASLSIQEYPTVPKIP
jgi:hypothetical protein